MENIYEVIKNGKILYYKFKIRNKANDESIIYTRIAT